MKAIFTSDGKKLNVELSGEIDHHTAKKLMDNIQLKIETELPRDCRMDMTGVTFMDSSGIAVVLKTYRLLSGMGGRLWVENVPQQPMHVFDAAGIDRIIRITALV